MCLMCITLKMDSNCGEGREIMCVNCLQLTYVVGANLPSCEPATEQ